MNRALPLIVLVFALVFYFFSERQQEKLLAGTNPPKTILLWAASTPAQTMLELKAQFETLHPEYQVEIQTVAWQSLQEKTLWAVAANSNVPDLVVGSSEWTGGLANNGALEPFDKYLPASFFDQFFSAALGTYQFPEVQRDKPGVRGPMRQYGIPFDLDMMMIFYRFDVVDPILGQMHLKTFPQDWDTFAKLGARFHAEMSKPGHEKFLIYLDPGDPVPMRMAFLPSSGGMLFNKNLTRVTFDSPESVAAFDYFAHLIDTKTAKEWNNSTQGDPMQLLKTDRVFGNIAGPWFGKVLEAQVPDDAGKWRVAPFPRRRPDLPSTGLGGSCLVMPYNAPNKPGAIELAKFMCTDSFALSYFVRVGSPPPIKSIWRNPIFDEPLPYFGDQSLYQVARQVIENSRPLQLLPNAEVVKNDVRWAMNEISTKGADTTKTLNIAAARANATLQDEAAQQ